MRYGGRAKNVSVAAYRSGYQDALLNAVTSQHGTMLYPARGQTDGVRAARTCLKKSQNEAHQSVPEWAALVNPTKAPDVAPMS